MHDGVTNKLKTEHRIKIELLEKKVNQFELENAQLLTEHSSNLIKQQDARNIQEDQAFKINELRKNLETCETELKNERDHNAQNVVKLKSQNTLLASKDIKVEAKNDACDSKTKKQYKSFGCQVGSILDPDKSVFNPNQECVDGEESAKTRSEKGISEKEEELNSRIEFWEEENKKLIWKHSKEQMELNFKISKYKKSEKQFESQGIQLKNVQSDLMTKEIELETCKDEILRMKKYRNEKKFKILNLETRLKEKSDEQKSILKNEREKILSFCKNMFSDGLDKLSSLGIEADATPEAQPVSHDLNNNVANLPTDLGDGETMMLTKNINRHIKKEV